MSQKEVTTHYEPLNNGPIHVVTKDDGQKALVLGDQLLTPWCEEEELNGLLEDIPNLCVIVANAVFNILNKKEHE